MGISPKLYFAGLKRLLTQDIYLVANRTSISSNHNLGDAIFDLVFSKLLTTTSDPTLLQIGANDGKGKHDVYNFIIQHKIRSVLVEPQPDVFTSLLDNYANLPFVVCENAAIDFCEGSKQMYRMTATANQFHVNGQRFGDGIASYNKNHVWKYFLSHCTNEGRRQLPDDIIESVDVSCITASTLYKRHAIERVDVLIVDTEGFDFEILKMIDIRASSPSLIKFEHKHLSKGDRRSAWELLRGHGFKLFLINESGDTVAVKLD